MAEAVARKNGSEDTVKCTDGIQGSLCGTNPNRYNWDTGSTQNTAAGSSKVFAQGFGVVREGDAMASHPDGNPCTSTAINHAPTLSTFSDKVFVEGKGIGRVKDKYNSDEHYDHEINKGSTKVFAG
jgi:hypothetical protein